MHALNMNSNRRRYYVKIVTEISLNAVRAAESFKDSVGGLRLKNTLVF